MKDFYDAIYLSPHLDDVALSCGGQIYELTAQKRPVLIVTLMAGNPISMPASQYVQSLHQRWQLDKDVVQTRRTEDIAASKVLGADWLHLDFLDCIYRVDPHTQRPLYTSDEEIFGDINSADLHLIETIAAKLSDLPLGNRIIAPLTLGQHVDHQLTRQAAERCFSPTSLHYYEDYPYAQQNSAEQFIAQQKGIWLKRIIQLTDKSITARIQSIKCFHSQLNTFFTSEEDLERKVRNFINSIGGERIWIYKQDQRWIA